MKIILLLVFLFWTMNFGFSQESPVELLKAAVELNQQQQYEASLIFCNRVIEIKPESDNAWFLRGFNNYNLENHKDAIKDFTNAINHRPDYTEAYFYRGKSHQAIGNLRNAFRDFKKARQVNSSETTLLFLKGFINSIFGSSSKNN
jgi:tetratricopeptide (TPR) repeat protein